MPDILVRNVPGDIVDALERTAGRRKREQYLRDLLVKSGEQVLLGEGRLLLCMDDFMPPVANHHGWLSIDLDPDLDLLFRRGIISNPRTRGRLLPKAMWKEGPGLLKRLVESHLVLPVPYRDICGNPFEDIVATLAEAVEKGREPPQGFFEINQGDTGIVPEYSLLLSAVSELTPEQLGLLVLVTNSFFRMMRLLAEQVRHDIGIAHPLAQATNLDRLVVRGADVIESLVIASQAAAGGERLHGCMIHPDEVEEGMHPSEVYLTLCTGNPNREHVSVSRQAMFGACYPVGEVVERGLDGRLLVDLSRETDRGSQRVYVLPEAVFTLSGPHAEGEYLVSADVRGLADILVQAARTYQVVIPRQASRAGYIGGLLGMVAEVGIGGRSGVNVDILRMCALR